MNRNILNQAFIGMGYRQMTNHNLGNIYGKQVGFGLVIAKINQNHNEISMKTFFHRYDDGKPGVWGSEKINIDFMDPKTGYEIEDDKLYEMYVKRIAHGEYNAGIDKIITPIHGELSKPFDFIANNDIISIHNI